jgi:hypothetical protein
MRWQAGRFVRELPPLTVEALGVWHACGTDEPLFRRSLKIAGQLHVRRSPAIGM